MGVVRRPLPQALRYLIALAAVGAVTGVGVQILGPASPVSAAMLYLATVLAGAIRLGRGPAVAAAVAGFLCLNWFFFEPPHRLTVADPRDLLALFVFLLTAVVTAELVARERARADEARGGERDSTLLYEIARALGAQEIRPALENVAERLRDRLGLVAIVIETEADAGAGRVGAGEPAGQDLLGRPGMPRRLLRTAGAGGSGWVRISPPKPRSAVHELSISTVPLVAGGRANGALHVAARSDIPAFTPVDLRLLNAAATQVAAAAERATLRRRAIETEVLRRGDELRTALLGAVSHDLRTPLASILASASSLRDRDVAWTEGERDGLMAEIEAEARRLDRLVGNLLDLSRIQAGRLRPERAWHDAGALVEDVVARVRQVAGGHELITRIPSELAPGFLDYVEIDQVLTNLIENAVRYAPAGTAVEVAVEASDGAFIFSVEDRGPGLPPDEVSRAFEPFARVGRHGRDGRVGLGLAIARQLTEAHGGTIWYELRSGGGSRFVFSIPQPATAVPA